mmetsp:Transcript_1304/g.2268  ORF Transcript_1304/g.2268 Transcript_1304/m.2268 type:complete len:166 (-) Transcript_1304:7-504(-)
MERTPAVKVLARLMGMDLLRCLDVEGSGYISRVVLIRALKAFDKVFTDDSINEILSNVKGCNGDSVPIAGLIELIGSFGPPSPLPAKRDLSLPLDAERLERLVRTGSSASTRSNWEEIRREHQALVAETGGNRRIDTLIDEGDRLRAERARLHAEHVQLAASIEA